MGPRLAEWELWDGGPLEEPDFEPLDGFARIERPRLKMRFVLTVFGGCRRWDSLELASLEELIGPTIQRIWVSPMVEIVVTIGPGSD